jgi:hypothetical protein
MCPAKMADKQPERRDERLQIAELASTNKKDLIDLAPNVPGKLGYVGF